MIIYGTKGKVVKNTIPYEIECSHCGTSNQSIRGHLRYFHLFFIPFLITKRTVLMQCNHCMKAFDFSNTDRKQVSKLKKAIFPFKKVWGYYFIPLAFMAFIMFSFAVATFNQFF